MRLHHAVSPLLLAATTVACSGAATDARERSPATTKNGAGIGVGSASDAGGGPTTAASTGSSSDDAILPAVPSTNVSGLYLASCSAETSVSYVVNARAAEEVTACRITQDGKDVPPEAILKIEIEDKAGNAREAERVAKTTNAPWTLGFKLPLEETSTVAEVRFVVGDGTTTAQAKVDAFDYPWTNERTFTPFLENMIAELAKGFTSNFVAQSFPDLAVRIGDSGSLPKDVTLVVEAIGDLDSTPPPSSGESSGGAVGGGGGGGGGGPLIPAKLPRSRAVFASSEAFAADFGGAGLADAHCLRLAKAASLLGTWRAYLDSATQSAGARLGIADGWSFKLVTGTVVAQSGPQFVNGPLEVALDIDENGRPIGIPVSVATLKLQQFALQAWNGSGDATCDDWSSTNPAIKTKTADLMSTAAGWLEATARSCVRAARLICVRD